MKRRLNLIALMILVSVNVLTPISYAQENPEAVEGSVEKQEVVPEPPVASDDTENNEVVPQNPKTEENIEEPETPSAMDIISGVVEEYKEVQQEEPKTDGENKVEESDNLTGIDEDVETLEMLVVATEELENEDTTDAVDTFSTYEVIEEDEIILGAFGLNSKTMGVNTELETVVSAEENNGQDITVTLDGNDGEEFTFKEISIEFADGEYYTLMDRNLGAKEVFNGDLENPNELSFGYFYQHGNNHGFSWRSSGNSGFAVGSTESLSTDVISEDEIKGYGPGGEKGYYSNNVFIYGSGNWYEGGENLWGDRKNDKQEQLKGPCPEGWHVPTSREILNIKDADAIVSALKIPFAGFRYYKDGVFYKGWRTFKTSTNETQQAWLFLKLMTVNGGYIAIYQTIDNGQELEEKNIKISSNFTLTDKNGNIKFQLKGSDSANGFPVRCFKNYNYITFDNGGGEEILKQKVDYGRTGSRPENPVKDGYYFLGWYQNPDYSGQVFDFTTPIENDITLYARRGEIIYNDGDITYTDTNGKVFSGMGTITFTDGINSITMLDRNLGATSTLNDAEGDSNGYYFQWGNNYGFLPGENEIDIERVDVTGYGWNNPYVSEKFIVNTGQWNYSELSENDEEEYADSLWGGFGDYRDNTWYSSEGYDYMRQGPCPDGYHVPSGGEWIDLVTMWADANLTQVSPNDKLAINTSRHSEYYDFLYDFYIPLMGRMDYNVNLQPVAGGDTEESIKENIKLKNNNKFAYARSSSPYYLTADGGYELYGDSRRLAVGPNAKAHGSIERSNGFSVRCFADNYAEGDEPLVLSYDTRGGSAIQAQTVPEGENEYLPGYTTHRTGYELLGWYDDQGELELDGNKITNRMMESDLSEDGVVTIYARWSDDHVVTFKDYDGRVIKVVLVRNGANAQSPANPTREGYKFTGWDKDLNNVTEDMEVTAQYSSSSNGGYSGGGGSSSKPDKSHNSADDKEILDTKDSSQKVEEQPSQGKTLDTTSPSKETFNAHQWAYSNGLTKYRTAGEARMDDPLNRSEMAKISSIFATEFLDKLPNEKKKEFCSQYPDLWKVTSDMEAFIIESCELGYMGYESNGIDALERFRPYTPVTVAEAATILSRIVWGNDNAMNGKDWYKGHLYATYNHGLIDDIQDPTKRSITRREAYLMLYRLIKDK